MGKRQGLTYKQVLGLGSANATKSEIVAYTLLDRDDGLNCTMDFENAERVTGRDRANVYRSLDSLTRKRFVMGGRPYPVLERVRGGHNGAKAVWFDRLKFETIGGLPF